MTSEEKINLVDWQRANPDNHDEDIRNAENKYLCNLEVLTFRTGNKGFEIISTYKNQVVFVDKKYLDKVVAGDIWLCRLKSNSVDIYYAEPILKITLSEIMNFNEELRENVLSSLWAKNRKELSLMLEGRLRKEIQEKLIAEVNENNSEEKNRLNKRIEELESELRETRFQLDAQEKTNLITADDDYILLSSDNLVKPTVSKTEVRETYEINTETDSPPRIQTAVAQISQTSKAIPQIKRVTAVPLTYNVKRISGDTLRSPSFTDRRYFAHLSPDYHTLVIRPDDEGKVYCVDNKITLEGLHRVSPFNEDNKEKILPAEYSEIYEGMIVRL